MGGQADTCSKYKGPWFHLWALKIMVVSKQPKSIIIKLVWSHTEIGVNKINKCFAFEKYLT